MKRPITWGLMMVGLSAFAAGRADAGFLLSVNAAGSQASTVSGVTTESFNSFNAGEYTTLKTAVGQISSPGLAIVTNNQYGGAGGTGNYIAIGAESGQTSMTLTLNGPQAYFGFWWSAADALNQVEFLSGGKVVASFSSSQVPSSLASTYGGNPNNGQDPGEEFGYLNVIGTAGSTFDQVVFLNTNTSTGFESDNWSVSATPLGSNIPGQTLGYLPSTVPEPSSMALTASGILALVGVARYRRRA